MLQRVLITFYLLMLLPLLIFGKVEDSYHNPVFNRGRGFQDLSQAKSYAFRTYKNETLKNVNFIWSDFNNGEWINCEWDHVSLIETSAQNVKLSNCQIHDSLFIGVDLRGAKFNNVNFKDNIFISCRFDSETNTNQLNVNYSKAN